MSRYKAYSAYRDSGVEWLGMVPSHWTTCRIKNTATVNPAKSEVREMAPDTEVAFIPMEAIGENGELDTSRTKPLSEVISGYSYVADGDIMVAKITPCFENGKGAIARNLTNGIGFATTEIINVRPNNPKDSAYLHYLLSTNPFRKLAEGAMYGAGGQKRVADSFVAEYHFSLPEPSERPKIAAFLDHETAKIDALIEKQQRLIELLKEKRQAVISHAVNKGLNPNAPMKDSGVEWLGEVPAHWGIQKLGRLFSESNERALTKEELEYPILSVSINHGISDKELDDDELDRKVARSEDKSLYKTVKKNHLVYNMMRAWQGGFGASTLSGLVSPAYVVCKPKTLINSLYFELALRTSNAVAELKKYSRGITDFRLRLYWDEFKNIQVPVPPDSEISDLLKSISETNSVYDKLVVVAQKQIELLQERRSALISAAVTGKIDVRDWQPAAA